MTTIANLMDLRGRLALVTGAAGNLGKTISHTLAEMGADLLLVDLPNTNLESLRQEYMEKWNVQVDCHSCDMEMLGDRDQLIDVVLNQHKTLSVLVNNAAFVGTSGLTGWATSFEEQTVDTWRRALEVNLTAVFDISKRLMAVLKNSPGANIINVASIYGELGPDWSLYDDTEMANPAAYSASKGGLLQLTRWLATTSAPDVRVNAISPGGIYRSQPDVFVKRYNARTPLNRMASEDDFIGVVAYLASDLSGYVTGQNIIVDGGWSAW